MSDTPKHTPGPWMVYTANDEARPYILQDDSRRPSKVIAVVFDDDERTRHNNARLLAAAPDLYAALTDALQVIIDLTPHTLTADTILAIRRALDKAMPERD